MEDFEIVGRIIRDYPDALSERKKLQALFLDFFPQDRLKRNTLLMVYDDGIVNEMKGLAQMDRMVMHRFVKSVEQGYGIRSKNAESAVLTWAQAMGLLPDHGSSGAGCSVQEKVLAEEESVKE